MPSRSPDRRESDCNGDPAVAIADRLHAEAAGLRPARIDRRENLILYEGCLFERRRDGVEIVLRRARIAGRVEIEGDVDRHFADILNEEGDLVQTVALDGNSFRYLMNKLRPRVAR